jgi:hypothetical protein
MNYSDEYNMFIVKDNKTYELNILDTKGNFNTIKNKYINNTRCNIKETEKITVLGIFKTIEVNYNSICVKIHKYYCNLPI